MNSSSVRQVKVVVLVNSSRVRQVKVVVLDELK